MLDEAAVKEFEKRVVDRLASKFVLAIIAGGFSIVISLGTAAYAVGILSERVATTTKQVDALVTTTKVLVDRNERLAVLEAIQSQQATGLKEIRDDVRDLVSKLNDVLDDRRRGSK